MVEVSKDGLVTVTQADMDRAATFFASRMFGRGKAIELEEIIRRENLGDGDDLSHLFARHRIEATATLQAERDRYRVALEPFAAMGRVIEARAKLTFGRTVPDSEIVSESSGEVGMGILVMGHFRDAATLLPNAPGWGGIYRSPIRTALSDTPTVQS